VLVRLDRRHSLQQQEACSARPNPQHNPLNLLSVVLVLLDPLVLPPEQGSVHLASSNNNRNHNSNHSNSNSNRPGPGLVRSVKHSHSNRQGLGPADLVPRSRSKPAAFSVRVALLSVKNPPPVDSVRVSRVGLAFTTNTSKEPQPQVLVPSGPVPEPLARHSPRPPLALARLPNSPRQERSAQGDLVLVSLRSRFLSTYLTPLSLAANKSIFGQPAAGGFGSTTTGTGTGIFGQQPQQQQPAQQTTGLFGNTTTGTAGTGLFGQQQQPQQTGREYINDSPPVRISSFPSIW